MAGEHLDLTSDIDRPRAKKATGATTRRFVGVHFVCCDVYTRIYVNREHNAYKGNCPKCGKRVTLRIAPGGTDSRFFAAR